MNIRLMFPRNGVLRRATKSGRKLVTMQYNLAASTAKCVTRTSQAAMPQHRRNPNISEVLITYKYGSFPTNTEKAICSRIVIGLMVEVGGDRIPEIMYRVSNSVYGSPKLMCG
jgi:hypothetical protein